VVSLIKVGDEAVHKEWGDRIERAATTASSLEAEQDSEDGTMKITATIDGKIKTITEASIRRHLELEDSDGIRSLPNTEIFEQLALMGLTLNKLMVLCTTLSKKVEDLQSELQQTKLTYGAAYTKLILRVKKLEHTVKTSQHRRRARVVLSDDEEDMEDPSKQGRKIAKIDENPSISLSAEKRKDKGKAIMKEDKSVQKKSKKQLEQERLGHEEAIGLQEQFIEEERQRIARDAEIAKKLQEVIAEAYSAHDIDWNYPVVLRYHALQNRSFSKAEVRKNMCTYLKNQGGYKQSYFKRMSYEDIRPIFKRKFNEKKDDSSSKPVEGSRKKTVAKKRIGAKLDEENAKRQKLKDVTEEEATAKYENEKEELRLSLKIIHNDDSEVNYEPLSRKFPIVSWEYQLLEKMEAKDMEMNQLDWKLLRWNLHENFRVHTLFMDGALMEINMLVEKKYLLIKELLERMLNLQLEAEEESTMAFELIKFIKSLLEE
nr:hypothetical protein [Tanacetum cinerariifolium]